MQVLSEDAAVLGTPQCGRKDVEKKEMFSPENLPPRNPGENRTGIRRNGFDWSLALGAVSVGHLQPGVRRHGRK